MEYEMWFGHDTEMRPKDPTRPMLLDSDGNYHNNVEVVNFSPFLAHAVRPGTTKPMCGTTHRAMVPQACAWTDPRAEVVMVERCPICLENWPV
ncbi:hypothetical protein ACFHW2_21345 [Actinomadura sp. LOL_016]|uniref:hypothetical protein n=1 Tax=unclassified Actinomadura TaxID=2626254 RepID=UPI003A80FD89